MTKQSNDLSQFCKLLSRKSKGGLNSVGHAGGEWAGQVSLLETWTNWRSTEETQDNDGELSVSSGYLWTKGGINWRCDGL